MSVLKYVSVQQMLAKIYSDLGYQVEVRFGAMAEWMAEALEAMNATAQYDQRQVNLKVENFRAKLPCGLESIIRVAQNGQALAFASHDGARILNMPTSADRRRFSANSYAVNWPYLIISRQTADIQLLYMSVVVDEEGMPMIPDFIEYKDALLKYVVYKLKYADAVSTRISYAEHLPFKADWEEAAAQARIRISAPTPDQMFAIGNRWQRLWPKMDERNGLNLTSNHPESYRA